MAKGRFKAHNCQEWFNGDRHARFEGEELVVGIDCAKFAFYAAFMSSSWQDFDVVYFERDEIGTFVQRLKEFDFKRITLVVEPTGTYSDPLVNQARTHGLDVVRISGSAVHKAEAVFDGVPSLHDGKAGYLLARLYMCGVGDLWLAQPEADRELRALVNMDQAAASLIQQMVGPLEAHLARHWPELTSYLKLGRATLFELLSTYGSPAAVAADKEEAARLMRKVGGNLLKPQKIDAIIDSAQTTLGVPMTEQECQLIRFYAGTARDLQKRSLEVKQVMRETALSDERTQPLVGFTGKRTAVVMVAYLGTLTSYESRGALEKAMGINLCERSTGQTRQDKQATPRGLHISKRGAPPVRSLLYFLAMRMINPTTTTHCPVAAAWYGERLKLNGGARIKGLVALMRKLVGALWWVARGENYDAHKLFDVPRLKRLGYLRDLETV